jgi:hypothetical protein
MLYPFELRAPPFRTVAWKPVLGGMRSGLSTVILPHGGRTGRAGSWVGFYGCDDRLRVTADRQKGNHGTRDWPSAPRLAFFEM